MPVPALFVTPYGRPTATRLRERLSAAKADDPLYPVTVLVPTNYVGVSTRRLLASEELGAVTAHGGGIAGLTLLTVYRLAELLGAPALAAAGRRPVSTPLLGAVVREVLRAEPGIFAPVVEHPSTERALVRAYRELSDLTPDALDALAAGPVERVRHVVRIHRAVRGRLAAGWYDEADLMHAAAEAIRDGSPVLDDLGTVLVHLPERLSLPAAALLRTLADAIPVEVVAGLTGVPDADADVLRSLRRLGLEPAPVDVAVTQVTEIVSVSDAEEEARSAVDRVLAAVRDGVPLARIAVLYPQPEPYARILDEQLAAAGIAWNGAVVRPLSDRMVGRWLLDLFDLDAHAFARPAVMGLLTSAPVVRDNGWSVPGGAWERISREAGVVRGRSEWHARLTRHADSCQRRADDPDPDAEDWMVERDRRQARQARELAATVGELGRDLDRAARTRSWSGLAGWSRRMIARWISRHRDDWPEVERDAADRVDAALDRLAGLDATEPATDLATFRRALAAELDDDLGRVGALGHGVLVGTPASALGVDLDVVIVLGMAEGLTPTRPREDSLLPDVARRTVEAQLRPRDERAGMEHRHLLAALAGARSQRILVFPRGDLRRSTEHAPSRWLADAVERLGGGRRTLPPRAPWLDTVASFAGRVRTVRAPATARQYALRALAGAPPGCDGRLPDHPHVAHDSDLHRAAAMLHDRTVGRFGRFTGHLAGPAAKLAADHVRDRVASATALEQWLECPHAYLLRHVLGVKQVDNPEELLQITPLERGDLVHRVLDAWLRDRIDAGVPAPDDAWSPEAVDALRAVAATALDDAEQRGVTGHPVLWDRDRARITGDLEAFVDRDLTRRRDDGLTPEATELPFGFPGGLPALRIELGDGRSVQVRGRIDRVDVAADGTVFVTDYKTGRSTYTTVSSDDPLAGSTRLQLPIYGLALRDRYADAPGIHTEYWFITHAGRGRRIGYRLTDDVVARLRSALALVIDGIDAGLFPRRPPAKPSYGSHVQCVYCDPDGLGTAQLYRAWERIRTDPALRAYVQAVEPGVLDDDADPGAVA